MAWLSSEAAFDCPRHHAAYHEGGHAITGRFLFGWIADKLEVRPSSTVLTPNGAKTKWSGMTFAEGRTFQIDASTDPADDFKEALHIFAGKVAEMLIFPKEIRYGSSLDEEEIIKAIATTIKIKTGADFESVFMAIMITTGAILKRHENCLRAIGEHLLSSQKLPGAELEALFLKPDDGTLCLPAHLAADLREKKTLARP